MPKRLLIIGAIRQLITLNNFNRHLTALHGLINQVVQIGNTNVFPESHEYDYENFMDEFSKLNAVNGDLSHSLANGLIDIKKWATVQRVLIADCSRFTDRDVLQSIQVLGTNAA